MSSNRSRRIERLLPTLSAQERAIFVLRQYKTGTDVAPAVLSTMPRHQIAEFNRYVRLMNTVNSDLGAALLLIDAMVKQTDIKYGWLMSLMLFADEIEGALHQVLHDTTDLKIRRGMKRLIARSPGALNVPLDLTSDCNDSATAGLVRALVAGITDGLQSHWRELRAIEIVVDEVADEFDGEDPLRLLTRKCLDDAKAHSTRLSEEIERFADGFELEEPTDDDVELVRQVVKAEVDRAGA